MPNWITHAEGAWPNQTSVTDCNSTEQTTIINAYDEFMGKGCIDDFPLLRERLTTEWTYRIWIDCTDSEWSSSCGDVAGMQSLNWILICVSTLSSGRVPPVVLHELVHAVGGTELDSEAVEHHCYVGDHATLPCCGDYDLFLSETDAFKGDFYVRKGRFVVWDSTTGEVWGYNAATDSKGSLCFQSNNWKHYYDFGAWP